MYKILLVEDDASLASAVKNQLECYGNSVSLVQDFSNVIESFKSVEPHLVLMDIMLPFKDGYYWTAEIRKISNVPVVFLSSACDNMNIVMAINMGGDDFIPKPVESMVLNAKVQAILRRTYELQGVSQQVSFCGAVLNQADYTMTNNGKTVELTKNEFKILQVLLENRGRIVSREAMMTRLWQSDLFVEENTLTVNVGRLRKKLEEIGLSQVIVTKPGSGYMVQ